MAQIGDKPENQPEEYEKIKNMRVPVVLLLNKTDLVAPEVEPERLKWQEDFPQAKVIPFSAKIQLESGNADERHCEPFAGKWALFWQRRLDRPPERFFVTEVVREKILLNYKREIPYSCEVVCSSFTEDKDIIKIAVEIYVERESQKPILIGKGGEMLKKVGIQSRTDLEKFFGKNISETHVRVSDNWRNNESMLHKFGYRDF